MPTLEDLDEPGRDEIRGIRARDVLVAIKDLATRNLAQIRPKQA